MTKIPDGAGTISEAYGAIEELVKDVGGYSQTWLNYQALWDMEMSAIVDRMDNLESWMSLLTHIRYIFAFVYIFNHLHSSLIEEIGPGINSQ